MSTGKQLASTVSIGVVLFPDLTLLDVAGPYEVFNRMPGRQIGNRLQ